LIGKTISHYRILSELGRGGMGVVYEAEDTLLGRRAALKFLPDEAAQDPQSLARFQREARAAAALNHSNICTIYEIGEQAGRWFIAMELLDGQPLSSLLPGGRISIDQLLDWAIQAADALDAAHARGIVHRDLKPSNVFLTKRGQIKVLDFGLAKMAGPMSAAAAATALGTATLESPVTSPGVVMGTVAFMSPEQARGENLDAQSDLFSFGTLLYQMATGRLPFQGKTTAIIFDAILNREPVSVSELNPGAPAELERIIARCLEKDRSLRYLHASDIGADLKRLKRDVSSGQARGQGATLPPAPAGKTASVPSSAIVAAARQHRVGFVAGAVIALAIVVAAAFGIRQLLQSLNPTPFQTMAITSITSAGDSWAAALSPDAKYLATLRRDSDGRDSLWMRHLPTNSNTRIVPPGDSEIVDVTFASDGNYLYFRRPASGVHTFDLYRVPILGGTPALVIHDIDFPPSFLPGGGRFRFERYNYPQAGLAGFMSANEDGSDEKTIFSASGWDYSCSPVWSPDGKHIAGGKLGSGETFEMNTIDASTGRSSHFFALPGNSRPDFLSWMPDGRGLIVVYHNLDVVKDQIAFVSYPTPEFHRITNDLNSYGPISLSADGKTIGTVMSASEVSLEVFPASERPLTDSAGTRFGIGYSSDWASDDQIVLTTEDRLGIQMLSVASGARTTLYSGSGDLAIYNLKTCGPHGVVFTGFHGSAAGHEYTLDLAIGKPQQVTSGKGEILVRCTPDGKSLIYYSVDDHGIHEIPSQGGKPEVLVSADRNPGDWFSILPDGREAVVAVSSTGEAREFDFFSLETKQVTRRVPGQSDAFGAWITPDGRNIAFARREHGVDNLWLQPVAGGAPHPLTDFRLSRSTDQKIRGFAWSPNGKRFAITRFLSRGDAVILRDQNQ